MATLAAIYKISADISGLQSTASKAVDTMESIERNTSRVGTALGSMGTKLVGAFAGFAVVDKAVTAITNLVGKAIETAGVTLDLANKTGLATDTIQRMAFVADQTGSSVEAFTRAAFMLGVNVEKGKGEIDGLGLSFAELKTLSPDEQFAKVVKALEEMEDPQERNRIAVELFGKAAQEILPSIAEGYSKIAAEASVSERAQLEAIDKASDAWDAFVANTETKIVSTLGSAVMAVQKFGEASWAQRAKLFGLQAAGQLTAEAVKEIFPEDTRKDFAKAEQDLSKVGNTLTDLGGVVIPPTTKAINEMARQTRELTKAANELVESGLKRQREENFKLMQVELQRFPILHAYIQEHRQDLMLIPPLMRDWSAENAKTTATLLQMVDAGARLPPLTQEQIDKILTVNEKTVTWRESLDGLAQAMTQLSQTTSNGFVSALASMTNAINTGTKAFESLKEGFSALTSGKGLSSILSGFTGIISGIGGIVAAAQTAIEIGKKLFSIFDRDKGRDMVEDFAKSFGGFDALHKMLNQLGDEGERLWILLTQGVGRNNKEQAAAAIEEVRRALEKLQQTANSIPRDIDVDITVTRTDRTGELEEVEEGVPSFAFGSGGIRDFGRGTLAMLHNREAVVTEPQLAALAGGGTTVIHNYVMLDGQQVGRSVTEYQSRHLRDRRKLGRG